MIAIVILALVFLLIAVRQVGRFTFRIWQVMLFGALAVLLTGQISPADALRSINIDVMLFLFGMFVIGRALEESGYLAHISYEIFKKADTAKKLLLFILLVFGLLSAFLMNDTIAIIGTPVVLLLARKHQMNDKPLLLALAFAVTIGSVMSPIGNPQNLLIALGSGMENPFFTFLKFLFIPTILNLIAAYFLLMYFYKEHFNNGGLQHSQEPIHDNRLAILSKASLIMVSLLILAKIGLTISGSDIEFKLTSIAVISMLPIVLFSRRRLEIVKTIDWHTLIFFAAMFIMMESVWETGFFQGIIGSLDFNLLTVGAILAVSILLSQLISNVPLVALYLPMLIHEGAGTPEFVALAAGSTIAGNLLILGAASNVMIIQNAEKRGGSIITFLDFAKIGIPLTLLNTGIYWAYLVFV